MYYRSEPYRWNEFPDKLYLFYVHFITGLQTGIIPAIHILKKMRKIKRIAFIQEILIDCRE